MLPVTDCSLFILCLMLLPVPFDDKVSCSQLKVHPNTFLVKVYKKWTRPNSIHYMTFLTINIFTVQFHA